VGHVLSAKVAFRAILEEYLGGDEGLGNIPTVRASVAIYRATDCARNAIRPFQTGQTPQGGLTSHGAKICPALGVNGRGILLRVNFDIVAAIEQDDAFVTFVAHQYVRAAANYFERHLRLP